MTVEQFINKKFIFYASGIFFCYFYYGILQEKITRAKYGSKKEVFTYSMSLVFVQCVINTIFAIIFNFFFTKSLDGSRIKDTTTHLLYMCSAFSYVVAMVSSNRSLEHVSYPTQVIAKSCKPIPVMLIGVLYAHKHYSLQKYFYVLLIVFGVGIFLYNPTKSSSSSSTNSYFIGELLLLLSLTMDGFTGAFQDRMKSNHSTKPGHMMLWMNVWSTFFLMAALILTGELWQFMSFVHRFKFVMWFILQFSLMSATGQLFIFLTIANFGPLACSLVTTTRKFFTVLMSVLLFGNLLTMQQWFGTILVFLGLGLDMLYGKQPSKQVHRK
ncbi:Solute carrier family 35 member B1 [Sarcoptes scabiei]|uniref:Solute carrier family 35 member B1 n=1 Tax=Sarcoptes scabiei TaxID=52283 RepID=A0A132A4T8_SARSC|nr:Solute carrier family 35 member B1 [Sarcoptes scabiei]KPM05420.1 solute carrier family 35-like protein 3 [Sarcoptes scabiei]